MRGLIMMGLLTAVSAISAFGQSAFKRDLEQISFIPKGQFVTGVSVSYTQSDQNNYQFLILEKLSGDTYTFKVSPMLFYAFANDLAVGGRVAYSRSLTRIDNARFALDSETGYDIENFYRLAHTFYTTAAFRNYMSLGANTRFGIFNEVQMQYGYGQSKLCNGKGDNITGTFETVNSFDIGLAPGVIVFLNNYSAIEVNVGVLGFSYSHAKGLTDQIYESARTASSANFRINLFSITFGVAFYI